MKQIIIQTVTDPVLFSLFTLNLRFSHENRTNKFWFTTFFSARCIHSWTNECQSSVEIGSVCFASWIEWIVVKIGKKCRNENAEGQQCERKLGAFVMRRQNLFKSISNLCTNVHEFVYLRYREQGMLGMKFVCDEANFWLPLNRKRQQQQISNWNFFSPHFWRINFLLCDFLRSLPVFCCDLENISPWICFEIERFFCYFNIVKNISHIL